MNHKAYQVLHELALREMALAVPDQEIISMLSYLMTREIDLDEQCTD